MKKQHSISKYLHLTGLLLAVGWTQYSMAEEELSRFIDPDADIILRAATDILKNADTFSMQVDITYDEVLASGAKVERAREVLALVHRPGKFRGRIAEDTGVFRDVFYNGKKITIYDIENSVYGEIKVPATIDEALDTAMDVYGMHAPLADIITSDPYANFVENATLGVYVGPSFVEDIPTHHLFFSHEVVDVQLWIDDGGVPLIRKLVITYKDGESAPQFRAQFNDWDFVPDYPDSVYEFGQAKSAQKIDILELKRK